MHAPLRFRSRTALIIAFSLLASAAARPVLGDQTTDKAADKVSYYSQIRPIFQAHCQGCHQPSKDGGDYVMTEFSSLLKGGESGDAAVVPGKPAGSYLVKLITPENGKAEMPKGKTPLTAAEIELVTRWITEGAKDDTPANAKVRYNKDNPPVYSRAPVITSLDYSPDGKYLAVAGFHEVLLHKADGSGLVARLVGVSERIESVRFSPDGKKLAVTGGLPSRMGEVQVWDVATHKLLLSQPTTYDTVYGAKWSPDGKSISYGCSDTTVRAINAETGEQVFFQGAHANWVLDTTFTNKGDHIISVGRDQTAKLTVFADGRFIDNITSITPGALKGGITSVETHPTKDEIIMGGADGIAKVFRIFRTTKRVIGDDANLIRNFPALTGRIFDIATSKDGSRIAVCSSLDGSGEVRVFAYDFNTGQPKDILAIVQKRSNQRSAAEKQKLAAYQNEKVRIVAETDVAESGIYAVSFSPDGKFVAAAGSDGNIRLIDSTTGTVTKSFVPVEITGGEVARKVKPISPHGAIGAPEEKLDKQFKIVGLEVTPTNVSLRNPIEYTQVIVTGRTQSGDAIDVTRKVQFKLTGDVASVSSRGVIRPKTDGKTTLECSIDGQSIAVPIEVSGQKVKYNIDYVRDVMPVVSRMGCNAGTCHGAKDGKNGFKLSLRGYDKIFDTRAFTDDLKSRRSNSASPDDSLMLMKATGAVPHFGSQVTKPGSIYYEVVRQWIADGCKLDLKSPGVASIELQPTNPVVQRIGTGQQVRVIATYADGLKKDVTQEAFIESGNTEIAESGAGGLLTTLRRGEAPILARFEGAYAATTLTVMGDRSGFVWKEPAKNNFVDELVARKLERMKIQSSGLCTDAEFIRRIYLDLTGLPPTSDQVRKFLDDKRDTKVKRNEVIDQLIGNKEFVEQWTNKWADMLQVNRKFLGTEGAKSFRAWIRNEVEQNTPYDQFAYKVLTASGSNKTNPPASYYKILRTPQETMENTTHLFLAVRFNCNKCHDHPFERWTQDQYYETAAFFAQMQLTADPASGKNQIGRTAVEAGKPLYEIVGDKTSGEITHDRTGAITPPSFPYSATFKNEAGETRRQQLAKWITSPDNQYFAMSYVNRVWGYLTGVGIIEPLDDIRAGNPPTNPELLDRLTGEFVSSGFDVRKLMATICKSRTYQLSLGTNEWNEDDSINYAHAIARRLPAEVLYDSLHFVTGAQTKIPGVAPGTRAAEIPDAGVKLPSGFLANLGRPARESSCECERSSGLQLGPVMALVSGPTLNDAVSDTQNELAKLASSMMSDADFINEIFLRIISRPATTEEVASVIKFKAQLPEFHKSLAGELTAFEKQLAPIMKKREDARLALINTAKSDLDTYQKQVADREMKLNAEQKARIAAAEKSLKELDAQQPERLAKWEKEVSKATAWTPIDPSKLESSNGAKLTKEKDLSIFVTGNQAKTIYKLTAETALQNITGVRLEALADDRLKGKGPGRPDNGNFVVSEFEVTAAPKAKPKEAKKVTLQNAQADFSQQSYGVATAIDGKAPATNNGWAIAPQLGVNHTAIFETKDNVGHEGGSVLVFSINQQFQDGKHTLGKFRISVTNSPRPVLLKGLSKNILDIVNLPLEARTDKQNAELVKYFRGVDAELKKRQAAVATAKKPRPIDPELKKRQDRLAEVSKPVPLDPTLVQLRADVKTSEEQLKNPRLTVAQDVAWGLINSPAFLFNR